MNTEHEVSWIENKTIFDKPAKEIEDTKGEKFTIYKFDRDNKEFPGFDEIVNGSKVTGNLYTNAKGYKTLYPPKEAGAPKSNNIAKMMDKKNDSIEKFQDKKEGAIQQMGSQTNAVNLVIAFYKDKLANDPILEEGDIDRIVKEKILQYKTWLLGQLQEIPF